MPDEHSHPGGLGRLQKDDPRDVDLQTLNALQSSFTPTTTLQNLADDPNFDYWSVYVLWKYVNSLRAKQIRHNQRQRRRTRRRPGTTREQRSTRARRTTASAMAVRSGGTPRRSMTTTARMTPRRFTTPPR